MHKDDDDGVILHHFTYITNLTANHCPALLNYHPVYNFCFKQLGKHLTHYPVLLNVHPLVKQLTPIKQLTTARSATFTKDILHLIIVKC